MTVQEFCVSHGIKKPIEFARQTGLSRAYAHQLWSGKRLIGRRLAKRLAVALQTSPDRLIVLGPPDPEWPASACAGMTPAADVALAGAGEESSC